MTQSQVLGCLEQHSWGRGKVGEPISKPELGLHRGARGSAQRVFQPATNDRQGSAQMQARSWAAYLTAQ